MSWLVLFENLDENESRLHNLLFLLEQQAMTQLNRVTDAGINDFGKQGKGVYSERITHLLAELRTEKLITGLQLTTKGKEIFRSVSSSLLYDPLYSKCLPFAQRYQDNLHLIDADIAANLLVKRAKPGEKIILGNDR